MYYGNNEKYEQKKMIEKRKKLLKAIIFWTWGALFLTGAVICAVYFLRGNTLSEGIEYIQKFAGNNINKIILIAFALYISRAIVFIPVSLIGALIAALLIDYKFLALFVTTIGITVSAVISFWIARSLGRKWVAAHEAPRLKHFDEKVQERGFFTVFVLRILFFIPFDPINLGSGFSSIKFRDYFWATFLGAWFEAAFQVLFVDAFSDPRSFIFVAAVIVVMFFLVKFFRTHPHFRELLNPFTQFRKFQKKTQTQKEEDRKKTKKILVLIFQF